ncbi:sulfite exporter TauE/SafE family protein [Maridesulfovibrio ferrireducens]|uniref:sulfite exporter TauE/SafE family protein n=1 Tax=Maridesulfovibrio ferrireducens TaxID=246191 RepID=UPI001A19BB7F|nr:sulfite exporter TauE/SafE family protein [Maridesulfovibrio ferrireducens]MBI9111063.1 sulfite exporter TauE/SafE family protein [Maridesulfovibrio ferrireducens]
MNFARKFYAAMQEAAIAHARWDLEVSTSIIRDKRKVWLIAILTALGLMVSLAFADDLNLPEMLGGKKAYTPAFYTTGIFLASIAIGLCAGLITGCIGAGGGFIITPALMSAGIKGILAVGTDLFHIFAKAIMGTAVHKKLGNVSVGLAVAFLVGSGAGVLGGGILNRMIYEANPVASDAFISVIYVVLLGFLGMYAMSDFLRLRKAGGGGDAHGGGGGTGGLPAKLQAANIPPMISFDEDLIPGGKKISGVFVALCGVIVGFMAAIMGVGGGFLTFPMFVYVLGVSSFTTVGTDILQIIFTAGFAAISQYAIYGFIFYTLAMGMLLGSLLGIQIGALVTKLVPGLYIRGFYALAILAGFVNRLFAMPGKLNDMKFISISQELSGLLANIGNWLFFLTIGVFAVWVIGTFLSKTKELREG